MPIAANSTYALVIVSLGILGVIVSMLITDRRKYYVALLLSLLVVSMGLFEFVSASLRQWQMSRRIAKLQGTQRLNLEALQERLRQASAQNRSVTGAPTQSPPPAAVPFQTRPAVVHKKK